jgi:hypothetical protein
MFLRNVGIYLRVQMASQLRRTSPPGRILRDDFIYQADGPDTRNVTTVLFVKKEKWLPKKRLYCLLRLE